VPVELELDGVDRLPEPVELTAYYVVSEALANTAEHAHASAIHVEVTAVDDAFTYVSATTAPVAPTRAEALA
jgi:signal transduction histidine kinase